ncbi:biotin transporter BioY [Pseudodesulfovibrio sp. zrk46]|uniref:biotin transporter BioY n=1 Tax=Pseudodesulfovibrio sp. zrk46 TaxID=2725288 RepID=UPI001449038C|nr:biotin transporter BioY [Pseudodesulfovibrio sp. zrk46]QJB56451.1 biotin transporter BioY [Pseudodesulfovibrio sp. zrk46]
MKSNTLTDLHMLVWTSLMAATISAGAYLIVPVGPVPVSMQPLFVFLAGYVLGPKRGAIAVGLYLLAGTIGLPVFAGGKSGLGHLLGPTGGYLFGFAASAYVCGYARRESATIPWRKGLAYGALALIAVYGIGAVWLKIALSMTFEKAILVGVVPFIVWDAGKVVLALMCSRYLAKYRLLPGQR